jgi:hypothetical protein
MRWRKIECKIQKEGKTARETVKEKEAERHRQRKSDSQ